MTKISIADVRKGDRIRATLTRLDRTEIFEGVAHVKATSLSTGTQWFTKQGLFLASDQSKMTIELLERKTREQELWEEVRYEHNYKDVEDVDPDNPIRKLINKLVAEENKTKGFSL